MRHFVKTLLEEPETDKLAANGAEIHYLRSVVARFAKELQWLNAQYQHVSNEATKYERERDEARARVDKLEREIAAVLDHLGAHSVRICESGGPESLTASLAASVSKLTSPETRASDAVRGSGALRMVLDACRMAATALDKIETSEARGARAALRKAGIQ